MGKPTIHKDGKPTVCKVDSRPPMLKVRYPEFQPPKPGDSSTTFNLVVSAEAVGGYLMRAQVQPTEDAGFSNFSIMADEATGFDGTDSAPSPLSYFTSGICFAMLSFLIWWVKTHNLKVDSMKIELRQSFEGVNPEPEVVLRDGFWGKSNDVEMHVIIESEEPEENIEKMYQQCIRSSYALQSVVNAVPLNGKLHLNDKVLI